MGGGLLSERIKSLGWRQGALLGPTLAARSRELCPQHVGCNEGDALVVLSHDCDVGNPSLEKEPVIELARAALIEGQAPDPQLAHGRNPRRLHVEGAETTQVLEFRPQERWFVPREWFADEGPLAALSTASRRQLARWTAKRFTRPGFPDAFEERWRGAKSDQSRPWRRLLRLHSDWIRGVYLRLHTHEELSDDECYLLSALVVLRKPDPGEEIPVDQRLEMEDSVFEFWSQFSPALRFDDCAVKMADEVTLAELECYRIFDADWVSEADGTELPPEDT